MSLRDRLLEVRDLRTYFDTQNGPVRAVDGVDFHIDRGETLAVVGESGSGKSVTSLSIMRLVQPPGRFAGGTILFEGEDLLGKSEREMRRIRGNAISMIFQEPMTSLNPVLTVGDQIAEVVEQHQGLGRAPAARKAVEMLELVGIPEPAQRARSYPHQMSGGMRQRAMIGMALACGPKLLIADEPTTALDVTIQAQILDLLRNLQRELGMSILFITHDLGVVAEIADRVVVMYAGQAVEQADCHDIFARPRMPYTIGLLDSLPRINRASARQARLRAIPGNVPNPAALPPGCSFEPRCRFAQADCRERRPVLEEAGPDHHVRCLHWRDEQMLVSPSPRDGAMVPDVAEAPASGTPLIELRDLEVRFRASGLGLFGAARSVKAVQNVSFSVGSGEVVGLVGESGSGKTTAGRAILGLVPRTGGEILFNGVDVSRASGARRLELKKAMQIIFQDPYSSLNPRMTVEDVIGEPLDVHRLARGKARRERIVSLLERVGLSPDHMVRYPHEFSGGQRQRIGIARALAVEPQFIVADEPVSALDVSIQAQVVNLLQDLKEEFGLTLLFIAHDLGVVEYLSDRVVVMYLGRIMEIAPAKRLYANPVHPYTEALLSGMPVADPTAKRQRILLQGDIPSPIDPPSGCVFRTRCPIAAPDCARIVPILEEVAPGHLKACIRRP